MPTPLGEASEAQEPLFSPPSWRGHGSEEGEVPGMEGTGKRLQTARPSRLHHVQAGGRGGAPGPLGPSIFRQSTWRLPQLGRAQCRALRKVLTVRGGGQGEER